MKCFLNIYSYRYGVLARTYKFLSAVLVAVSLILVGASAQAENTMTIAALGDSLTQGYGLEQKDGFTMQLQDWLTAADQDVIITNAGVSGDTTAGGLARVDWTLTPDVDAMIVALGGNDVLRGIDPAVARDNLDRILSVAADKGIPVLLVGIDVPDNFGPDYKVEFSAIYPDLAAKYDTFYVESFLRPVTQLGTMVEVLGAYFQRDGIHPNAVGVGIIVDSIGPKVTELAQEARNTTAQ